MKYKCEVCGKELSDPYATHCSEECIFKSINKARPVAYVMSRMVRRTTSPTLA